MADDKKEPHTAKPESLEAKFKLLALLPYDRRAKRKHSLVFGFILDWYHSKYGDALASVRHVTSTIKERDPAGAGLYAGDVHTALTDLVAWGYLEQEKGIGRRASRYVPVWAKLDSVRGNANTTDSEISVRENANTCVRENANATPDSVRDSTNEDPSTWTRSQDRGTRVDEYDCAAPPAPPPAGLKAAEAETAQEATKAAATTRTGFDELYRVYGVPKNKADARRAYEKLAPSPELHAKMVDAARLWKEAAGDSVERMYLRRWIEDEHYDDEPRGERMTVGRPKEGTEKIPEDNKGEARGKVSGPMRILEAETMGDPFGDWRVRLKLAGPAGEQEHVLKCLIDGGGTAEDLGVFNELQRAFGGDTDHWPGGRVRLEMDGERIASVIIEKRPSCRVRIAHAEIIEKHGRGKYVAVWFVNPDGLPEGKIETVLESDDQDEQRAGQERLAELVVAAGLNGIHDAVDMIGGELIWRGNGAFERLPYEPEAEAA